MSEDIDQTENPIGPRLMNVWLFRGVINDDELVTVHKWSNLTGGLHRPAQPKAIP